jgi:thiamine kinase-like enzyme
MEQTVLKKIAEVFWGNNALLDLTPLSSGLINGTWLSKNLTTSHQVILQKINTAVFPNPTLLVENHIKIWTAWKNNPTASNNFKLAQPLPFPNGHFLHIDENGYYWRAQEHFAATRTQLTAQDPALLYETAYSIGLFDQFLWTMDPPSVPHTIPRFHDLAFRYDQFLNALQQGNPSRLKDAAATIVFFQQREKYVQQFLSISMSANKYPKRLLHHDAKMANLLFKEKDDRVYAVIDLDTTMPGYFFSDLGDMIRSMAASAGENETIIDAVHINPDFYAAIVTGYVAAVKNELTEAELAWIHLSGIWMIYMQGLRFLTDFLLEDQYYRIEYPMHNFDRAVNQQRLLCSLEELLKSKYAQESLLA